MIAGPGVMRGYFGQPELTAAAFFVDDDGTRWYRTGDLVSDDGTGCFQFHGRRDRMVKKRGYRIELGEIESALYRHDGVDRAGVVAQADEVGVSIAAFVALKPDQKKSIIAMKRHCTSYLPHYMIPDTITFLDDLPATSTDKVDYQTSEIPGRRTRTTLVRRRIKPEKRRFSLSTRRLRRVLCWKFVFYDLLLPALRRLGPARGDAILGFLGRLAMAVRPRRGNGLRAALERASAALDADWSIETTWPALAANTARFLARDYPLDRQSDEAVLSRFDVRGYERLRATLSDGRGAILVGSHLGAHIAGVHWLFRRGVPLRLLVQRPRHVSRELNRRFDAGGIAPPGRDVLAPRPVAGGGRRARFPGSGRAPRRPGDLLERRHPLVRPQYLRRPAAGPSPALPGHLDRAGGPDRHAGLSRVLHSSARRPIRTRDRSHRPPPARRGRNRRRRLPQAARSPDRDLSRRRRRPPGLAVLCVASGTAPINVQAKGDRRQRV